MRHLLWRVGRWLISLGYTRYCAAEFKDLKAANDEIGRQAIVIHDLKWQAQEMSRQLAAERLRRIVANVRAL